MSYSELEIGYDDEVGDSWVGDEYVGADDVIDEIIGATRRRMPRGRGRPVARRMPPPQRQLTQQPGQLLVKDRAYDKARRYPLGWDSNTFTGGVAIAAGASLVMVQRPQVPFRPERLVIPENVGTLFLITTFLIGKDSQLMNGSPIPASAFSQGSFDINLGLDTAVVGIDITLTVQNISAAGARFLALMAGPALEK